MPWKLIPPREGKTKFYYVRGHYLGVALDHSTGTDEKRAALTILATWRRQAERGEFPKQQPAPAAPSATFLSAAVAYMQAGGERQFLRPIIEHWGEKPLGEIDQISVDTLASEIYPHGSPATRNRQVYTPVAAVLHRAGIERKFRRPKGWQGARSISFLAPEQAFALFEAADARDAELGLFLRLLCYTGMRLAEGLGITLGMLDLSRQTLHVPRTKNGEPRTVYLPPVMVTALANHPRGLDRHQEERLIRFHAGGRLRDLLKESMAGAGLQFPRRQCGFHLFRHTWAAWMRRYGGLDTSALVDTGAWRDRSSAARYEHVDASEEARKADYLPVSKAKIAKEGHAGD